MSDGEYRQFHLAARRVPALEVPFEVAALRVFGRSVVPQISSRL